MSGVDRYQDHLRRQLAFLSRSCQSYDKGFLDEAIRMATVIRVLLHNTTRSTSLLRHLQADSINLLSTCRLTIPPRTFVFDGMSSFPGPAPKLGATATRNLLPVDQWWAQTVLVLDRVTRFRRQDIVLVATNQDGGAHIDSSLAPDYERLVNDGMWTRVYEDSGSVTEHRILDSHFIALRQMAYELLHSPDLLRLTGLDIATILHREEDDLCGRAKTLRGEETDSLYQLAFEKYELALQLSADPHLIYGAWGTALSNQAATRSGDEADRLFVAAFQKFEAAIKLKPDLYQALNNWGVALSEQAKQKEADEAEALFDRASEKYRAALMIKPDHVGALSNWGAVLAARAKVQIGESADQLFQAAYDKYDRALQIDPSFYIALENWSEALSDQAATKEGPEAERLTALAEGKHRIPAHLSSQSS